MAVRIGVDIGGTFTDLVTYNDRTGVTTVQKVPTTPATPESGCVDAVSLAGSEVDLSDAEYFLHGTTVGLNALIERRGAIVGLLCTSGFRDALEIRRGSRPEAYDLNWSPEPPLVPRYLRRPVNERIGANGEVIKPLDPQSVIAALNIFREHDVTSIAICFMNSYVNPVHEALAVSILRDAGFDGDISASHSLSREYRDYERASTTVVDAFVRTKMADYTGKVEEGIRILGFTGTCLITRSGGGAMSFSEANQRSFETINSGPVAGVEGAAELSRAWDLGDLITADIGGTSFDTALIRDGRPQLLYRGEIAGMPIQAPWVDVRSVGAGGGSIAWVDTGGLLHVGPGSAGAQPGPACYGRGGEEPTVTDAAFYLGLLGEGRLASGLVLSKEKAEAALQKIASLLDASPTETAIGILRIACATCANAMREITVEQGIDPRELKLLAFGGAGPLLSTLIARELDIKTIVIPPFAGNFSAWGLLGADIVRTTSRTSTVPVTAGGIATMNSTVIEMMKELHNRSDNDLFEDEALQELRIGLRYTGQEHYLNVAASWDGSQIVMTADEMKAVFHSAYSKAFGISLNNDVEATVVRLDLRRPLKRQLTAGDPAKSPEVQPSFCHTYSFTRQEGVEARTLRRADLNTGEEHVGPAIISEDTATTFVDAGFTFGVDTTGCLIIRSSEF